MKSNSSVFQISLHINYYTVQAWTCAVCSVSEAGWWWWITNEVYWLQTPGALLLLTRITSQPVAYTFTFHKETKGIISLLLTFYKNKILIRNDMQWMAVGCCLHIAFLSSSQPYFNTTIYFELSQRCNDHCGMSPTCRLYPSVQHGGPPVTSGGGLAPPWEAIPSSPRSIEDRG